MKRKVINILIAEKSQLATKGLIAVLDEAAEQFRIKVCKETNDADKIAEEIQKFKADIVFLQSDFFINHEKEYYKLRKSSENTHFASIIYGYYTNESINIFDANIFITDDSTTILQKIIRIASSNHPDVVAEREPLTERELTVLKELAIGNSNKQIAEMLNISIHTVISHRKNISEKTGIRTLAGLTIYAISKKLIDLE